MSSAQGLSLPALHCTWWALTGSTRSLLWSLGHHTLPASVLSCGDPGPSGRQSVSVSLASCCGQWEVYWEMVAHEEGSHPTVSASSHQLTSHVWSQLAMAVRDQGHLSVSYTAPSSRGAAGSGYKVFACLSLSSTSSLAAQQFSHFCLQFPKLHFLIFQYLYLSLFA